MLRTRKKAAVLAGIILTALILGLLGSLKLGLPAPFKPAPPFQIGPANEAGSVTVNPTDKAELLYVPAGDFAMGDPAGDPDEAPVHSVSLPGYWIYKTEVTVGQFRAFCAATGHRMPSEPKWPSGDDHPIVNVSWKDASDYALWAGVRLPTEAEWERAARTASNAYPWGSDWNPTHCKNHTHGPPQTAPVGSHPSDRSWVGCYDMAGNVSEWVSDGYAERYYETSPSKSPSGYEASVERSVRGGSWFYASPNRFRCTDRASASPYAKSFFRGFRCAASEASKLD